MTQFKGDEVTAVIPEPIHKAASQTAEKQAFLIVLSGTNVGQIYPLDKPELTIGREENVDLQLLDVGISRVHAKIVCSQSGDYILHDSGSRNGVYANNQRLSNPYPLKDGDKIQFGVMTVLKFSRQNDPETVYAQTMYEAALRDGLTGAYNRRYLEERLEQEFSFSKRHGNSLAVLFLDIDLFKNINDTHGHLVGDAVLKELSAVLMKVIRTEDVLARYGGEEFAILCRDTSLLKASILGERIRSDVASHVFIPTEQCLRLTLSIGVSALPDPGVTMVKDLMSFADDALYQAKQRGRNCVVVHRPEGSGLAKR